MNRDHCVVAIDGPVAAGKTTVGQLIADRLGAVFFDTGVLYRAVAHQAVVRRADPEDQEAIALIARDLHVDLRYPPTMPDRNADVLVNGEDVTDELRSPEVDRALPGIAANPLVREHLLDEQRQIAAGKRIVVVGRDIGTVVLPDAQFKYFIDATPEARAERRYQELLMRGADVSYEGVLRDLEARDLRDIERPDAPLRKAQGAVSIDATKFSANEIAEDIVREIRATQGCPRVD